TSYSWNWTTGTGVTTITPSGLTSGTTYYFKVLAYNAAGASAYSNVANATTMTLPAAPSSLTAAAISGTQITLNWTSNSGGTESGFKIYYSTNGTSYTWNWTTGTGVTTITPSGLTPGTTYYFKVLAYNAAGVSAYSNVANAATLALPIAPSNLTATDLNASQINLSWTNNDPSASGTKIYESTDGGKTYTWVGTVGVGVSAFTVSGLSAATT